MLIRLPGRCALLALFTFCLDPGIVRAQIPGFEAGFEGFVAAPAGVDLWDPLQPAGTPGQGNFYWPIGTTSVPFRAFTYVGNTLGVPPHPVLGTGRGGNVFVAGTGPAGSTYARAQHDNGFGFDAGPWTFATDVLVQFHGALPTAQNIGSFSSQSAGGATFIMLATWVDPNTAANWNADYFWYDAAGVAAAQTVPDPGFQNLAVDHWYRWESEIDLSSNRIVRVRLIDLHTSAGAVYEPVAPNERYLIGGAVPAVPHTGCRLFAGGGVAGNTVAFDNVMVEPGWLSQRPPPGPGPCVGPCCYPAGSLRASGHAALGDSVRFDLHGDLTGALPGAPCFVGISFGGILPCAPVPWAINGLMITTPPLASFLGFWPGAGMSANFVFPMPPHSAANSVFLGLHFFAQGVIIDAGLDLILLEGAELRLGG
ncbi:MAG: hypothetical protein KDC98_16490 [Planctomycetes bacterium]|nr:hypothetical protein [Planctomycetota bacterium]